MRPAGGFEFCRLVDLVRFKEDSAQQKKGFTPHTLYTQSFTHTQLRSTKFSSDTDDTHRHSRIPQIPQATPLNTPYQCPDQIIHNRNGILQIHTFEFALAVPQTALSEKWASRVFPTESMEIRCRPMMASDRLLTVTSRNLSG